jgi:hypothetical protein
MFGHTQKAVERKELAKAAVVTSVTAQTKDVVYRK